MPVRIGAHQPRGDLGAVDRARHDAESVEQHREIEAGIMEDLEHALVGEDAGSGGPARPVLEDLHHVGVAVALRDLHDAEPVPMGVEAERLGIDGDRGPGW